MKDTQTEIDFQGFETKDRFRNLFTKKTDVVDAIRKDMSENGYDNTQPIILAEGEWTKTPVLIDGHTRYQIASELNITDIPRVIKSFKSEDEAFLHAVHLQKDRRNLSDAELYNLVSLIDKIKPKGGDPKAQRCAIGKTDNVVPIKSSVETAKALSVSPRQVEKVRAIQASEHEDVKEAVKTGELSINKAEKEVQARKKVIKRRKAKFYSSSIYGISWVWSPLSGSKGEFTLDEDELLAPKNTTRTYQNSCVYVQPNNIFDSSDIFNRGVSQDWIDKILGACRENPEWTFFFHSQNVERIKGLDLPPNVWIGIRINSKESAEAALKTLPEINAQGRFLIIEPLQDFGINSFQGIEWVIIEGGVNDFRKDKKEIKKDRLVYKNITKLVDAAMKSNCKILIDDGFALSETPEPLGYCC